MIDHFSPFGHHVWGESLGQTWLHLVDAVLKHGSESLDEGRPRLALQNVRIKSLSQSLPDKIIEHYGNKDNLEAIVKLTFATDKMRDVDVTPSFSPGAKSYHQRIKEGQLIDFVVKRLTRFPESKKAVIVFPTFDDYRAVLANPGDDYLPCIVSVQFRLIDNNLSTTVYLRSLDVFQKAHGNLWSLALLSDLVADRLSESLRREIKPTFLDGLIADAHIYQNTLELARSTMDKARAQGDF
jgi:thymidylate synthase